MVVDVQLFQPGHGGDGQQRLRPPIAEVAQGEVEDVEPLEHRGPGQRTGDVVGDLAVADAEVAQRRQVSGLEDALEVADLRVRAVAGRPQPDSRGASGPGGPTRPRRRTTSGAGCSPRTPGIRVLVPELAQGEPVAAARPEMLQLGERDQEACQVGLDDPGDFVFAIRDVTEEQGRRLAAGGGRQ